MSLSGGELGRGTVGVSGDDDVPADLVLEDCTFTNNIGVDVARRGAGRAFSTPERLSYGDIDQTVTTLIEGGTPLVQDMPPGLRELLLTVEDGTFLSIQSVRPREQRTDSAELPRCWLR